MPWTTIPTSHAGGEDPDATPSCHHYVTMLQLAPVDSGTNTPNGEPGGAISCGWPSGIRSACGMRNLDSIPAGPSLGAGGSLYSGRVERKWWKAGRLWSMIDHISLNVSDAKASRVFYESALAPLGYRVLMEFEGMYGLGAQAGPDLWLVPAESPTPVHLALTAESTQQVDDFHRAALAAGGADNGAPGERPHYHPGYYGAFVLDPDGHNLEAVFHGTGK